MAYKWQFNKYKASPQQAGELFEEIEKRDGIITAESVLDAARPEDSVIHNDFEWDNAKAAEKYRLSQAQKMIQLLVYVSDDEKPPVRVFVNSVSENSKAKYINIDRAMGSDDVKKVILANARRDLEIFESKYHRYEELSKVIIPISEYLEETS